MQINLPRGLAYIGFAMLDESGRKPAATWSKVDDGWVYRLDVSGDPAGTTPARDILTYSRGMFAMATRDGRWIAESQVAEGLCFPAAVRALAMAMSTLGTVKQASLSMHDHHRITADGPVYSLMVYVDDPTSHPDDLIYGQLLLAIDGMASLGFHRRVSAPC